LDRGSLKGGPCSCRHAKLDGKWREVIIVEKLIGEAAR